MAYEQATGSFPYPVHHIPQSTDLESQGHRHRGDSLSRHGSSMPDHNRYAPPQKPIDEAVSNAFDRAGAENPNYDVPPELIAQITQNVIKQLQTGGGLEGSTPIPSQSRFSPPAPQQPVPISPSTASGTSLNMSTRLYTPPSPPRHSDLPNYTSPQSQSGCLPDKPQSPRLERSAQSQSGRLPDKPQSPRLDRSAHLSPRRSPSPSYSQTSESSEKAYTRPKGPSRLSTSKEETTLEKIWGQLFDEESHPTNRLGQFLRGLAIHIVCCISRVEHPYPKRRLH